MPLPALIKLAPLLSLLVCAALIDARHRRIPNWLTLGLLIGGIGRACLFGSTGSISHALLGMLVGMSIPLVLYCMSAMGGGDVKLMAAVGCWIGPGPVLLVFVVERVVGLVIVLMQALMQKKLRLLFRNSALVTMNFAMAGETGVRQAIDSGKDLRSIERPLPFAVPLLIAVMIVLSIHGVVGK